MKGTGTTTEKVFGIILQMPLDWVPAQRFEQSTKWTAKVTNSSKYVRMLQNWETSHKKRFS